MRLAITAAAAITPIRRIANPLLLIEDGLVASVWSRDEIEIPGNTPLLEFPGAVLIPGFIDLHVHGGAGYDVMSATADGLADFERHLARHGVTSYCPTTLTAPIDLTLAALDRLAARITQAEGDPARVPVAEDGPRHAPQLHLSEQRALPIGIHLEGPFLSRERAGVHPLEYIQEVSLGLFERFWQAARGRIRLMTVAPELPGALELIAEASRRGVCVALGHSNADYASGRAAIAAGARHGTHVFNAMSGLDHREPGLAVAVLNTAAVSAEVICDGVHVAPAMIELLLRVKGSGQVVLVSDAVSAAGMPGGRYRLGTREVRVQGNRCLSSEGKLAGSLITLDQAVRNAMHFLSWELESVVPLATLNPARTLGIELCRGALWPGSRADILALSPQGQVLETIIAGYRSNP